MAYSDLSTWLLQLLLPPCLVSLSPFTPTPLVFKKRLDDKL